MTEATPSPIPPQEAPEQTAETPVVKGFKERMTDWMYNHVGIVRNRSHRMFREQLNSVLDQIPAGTNQEQVKKIQDQFVTHCKSKAAAAFMWDATMVGAGVLGTAVLASPWIMRGPSGERVYKTAGRAARDIWIRRGRNPTAPLQKVYDEMNSLGRAEMQFLRASHNVTVKGLDFTLNLLPGVPWQFIQAGALLISLQPKEALKVLTGPAPFQFGRTHAVGKLT